MNTVIKPLASLTTLLARKGGAKPAMRRQALITPGVPIDAEDDLGWNDMGEPLPEAPAAPTPAVPVPAVLVQREALVEEFAAPLRTIPAATAARIARDARAKHAARAKIAFTLRLDTDRHLKLRLASALHDRSAQQLVTEALDAFLENSPEVATLVRQLPAPADAKRDYR